MKPRCRAQWSCAALLVAAIFGNVSASIAAEVSAPESVPVDGKINWVYDYQEGLKLSQQTGKPMFVVFRCER